MKKYFIVFISLLFLFSTKVDAKVIENVSINDQRFNLNTYGLITPLKAQSSSTYSNNTCWTFGTTASLESSILVEKIYDTIDLSEAHMEVATSNLYDFLPSKRSFKQSGGGTPKITSAYYFNRIGPVLEKDFKYDLLQAIDNNRNLFTKEQVRKKVVVSVNDEIKIVNNKGQACSKDTINKIKNYLINHGAMYAGIDGDGRGCSKKTKQNGIDYYCYSNSNKYTHEVAIVGWDDTIKGSFFGLADTNDNKGAFIIKDSGMGNGAFEYRSYKDTMLCYWVGGYYNIDKGVEDNVYALDTPGVNAYSTMYSKNKEYVYVANKYTKKSNKNEKLKKVTIYSYYENQPFDIFISYNGDLKNLTKLTTGTVKTDHIGYTTVKLKGSVTIKNKNFAIVVKYYTNNGMSKLPIYKELSDDKYFNLKVTPGLSFVSNDGTTWKNFGNSVDGYYYASIKGYTNNIK